MMYINDIFIECLQICIESGFMFWLYTDLTSCFFNHNHWSSIESSSCLNKFISYPCPITPQALNFIPIIQDHFLFFVIIFALFDPGSLIIIIDHILTYWLPDFSMLLLSIKDSHWNRSGSAISVTCYIIHHEITFI